MIEGVVYITPERRCVFKDNRGSFEELSHARSQIENIAFIGSNISVSKRGVIRGMHGQKNNPQGKLVRVLRGRILDAWIDARHDQPSYKEAGSIILNSQMGAIYLPPGLLHGFQALEDDTVICYCVTSPYCAHSQYGVHPLSTTIDWRIERGIILSEKDSQLPTLQNALRDK